MSNGTIEWDGSDRRAREPQGWHLDKKVPLSLIFAILVQSGMVIWAIADIKKDVEVLKADTASLHIRDSAIEISMRDATTKISDRLERVDAKLDRLIERGR